MDDRFDRIIRKWYIEEPALFQIYTTHNLEENDRISCVMRCGGGKIEYNPDLAATLDEGTLETYLRAEVIRIMLKHPYDRQPDGCRKEVAGLASNLVLGDNYPQLRQMILAWLVMRVLNGMPIGWKGWSPRLKTSIAPGVRN